MEYVVIQENDSDKMAMRVEELLEEGYELHGNLLLAAYLNPDGKKPSDRHYTIYAQAMTKPDRPAAKKARARYKPLKRRR